MAKQIDRRAFLKLAGMGGVVYASGLAHHAQVAAATARTAEDFHWVQLSDTHWGFEGPLVNPDAKGTLKKAVDAVNALEHQPDFVVFTGDLTHTTDDPDERRRRMASFRDIVAGLKVKDVKLMPGEHDASLDRGKAFREMFGETRYTFDHKGIHFIVLDNVSDPAALIGEAQLAWLQADLAQLDRNARIVVLTHRPLFDLYPQWDWATRDGAKALELLMPFANVTVFYGHIHQEHHQMTGHIAHHAARSLIFPLPAPGSVSKRQPIPWDSAEPYKGLGFRDVERAATRVAQYEIREYPVQKA
jgi:predicted phosphodiesterase